MTATTAFRGLTEKMMALYTDGKFAEAFSLVERNAPRFPEQTARTTFWKMCLLSLYHRPEDVLAVFEQGLDNGLWWAESQFADPDLDAVRDLPEFQRLVDESDKRCMEAQTHIQPDRTILFPDHSAGDLPMLVALHGRNGNKDSNLEYWEAARRRGWLVLSPQSRQAIYANAYCWDDNNQGVEDILFHMEEIAKVHKVDRKRIVVAGFSQGSGMAIYAALSRKINARGFIGVGTFMAELSDLVSLADKKPSLRGYFITGEKDNTLDKAREIQSILNANHIPFSEEVFPELGHAFPENFETSFAKAIDFIFKEQE